MKFSWEELPVREPVPGVKMRVFTGEKAQMVLFELEEGVVIPEHSHPHEQMGTVLDGRLRLVVDGRELVLSKGEGYRVPPGVVHSGEALEKSVVLDIFSPPREEYR